MPLLTATTVPLYWTAQAGGQTYVSDIAEIGGKIGIPPTYTAISDTDSNAYLGKVVGKGGAYNPIPALGQKCEANVIYSYNGDLVICRQPHNRTADAPATVPNLWSVYRAASTTPLDWIANEPVLKGMLRLYGGKTYVCVQPHTTQTDYAPDKTPALWSVYVDPATPQPWKQPTGSVDAYIVGAKVTYAGHLWQNTTPANVWVPGVYGWTDMGIYP